MRRSAPKVVEIPRSWGDPRPKFRRSPEVEIRTQSLRDLRNWVAPNPTLGRPQKLWRSSPNIKEIPRSWGDPHPQLWDPQKLGRSQSKVMEIPRSSGDPHPKLVRSTGIVEIPTQSYGDPKKLWRSPPNIEEIPRSWGDTHIE